MPLVEPEIDYINKKARTIHYKGGMSEPLDEEASFALFATPREKQIKQGVKESELQFAKIPGEEGQTFLKGLGENFASKLATDYFLDPVIAAGAATTVGEGQENEDFFDRMIGNYRAQRMGRREAKSELQQRNPKSAMAGTVGSLGVDVALPLPGSLARRPVAAGTLLGAASSEKSLLEDPMEVAKSAAIGGGVGAVVSGAERIARQRGALRAHPENVRMTHEANQNAFNDYRAEMSRKLNSVASDIPTQGIHKGNLGIEDFIDGNIRVSPQGGTAQTKSTINFLNSLEQGLPEAITARDINRVFDAVEGRIAVAASAEEVGFLNRFKEHLVQRIPMAIGEARSADKYIPRILRQFGRSIQRSLGNLTGDTEVIRVLEKKLGRRAVHDFSSGVMTAVDEGLASISPGEIVRAAEDGSLPQIMTQFMQNAPSMSALEQRIDNVIRKMESQLNTVPRARLRAFTEDLDAMRQAQLYVERINQDAMMSAVDSVNRHAGDMRLYYNNARDTSGSKISNAVGVQNPYISTNIPPTNARPVPNPIPEAPQVGGMATKFENPNYYRDQAKNLGSLKTLGPLAGLTYGLGIPKAVATGAVVGYQGLQSALRGITRPDAIGSFARRSIQRGGIDLILEQIKSYPSYRDGILLDPQDRRQAVAEIEVDQDLPGEDKAVLQAKINRGISLEKYIESIKGEKNGN